MRLISLSLLAVSLTACAVVPPVIFDDRPAVLDSYENGGHLSHLCYSTAQKIVYKSATYDQRHCQWLKRIYKKTAAGDDTVSYITTARPDCFLSLEEKALHPRAILSCVGLPLQWHVSHIHRFSQMISGASFYMLSPLRGEAIDSRVLYAEPLDPKAAIATQMYSLENFSMPDLTRYLFVQRII